jgi:HSP20 family molecular chaperone IbpA
MLAEPFSPLFELSRGVDRLLPRNAYRGGFLPPADVVVTDDAVTVMMDMPGLEADDLEIELQDDLLRVRSERRVPHGGDREARAWQRIERGFGKAAARRDRRGQVGGDAAARRHRRWIGRLSR